MKPHSPTRLSRPAPLSPPLFAPSASARSKILASGFGAALTLGLLCGPLLLAAVPLAAQQYQPGPAYGYGYGSANPPAGNPQAGMQPPYAQPQYGQPLPPQYAPQQPYAAPQYAAPPDAPQGPAYAPGGDADQEQNYAPQQPLSPDQLEQLVAPIALYPDALLAQVLTASTYPAQVAVADQWLHQMQAQGYGSAGQIAAGADTQSWDPSVKALTAFPQVLDMLNQNLEWTTELGNAYYNQPQDVMQTVQVMRQRAENAGNLENTPQESVSEDQGDIELAPPSPQVVYVPEYDPWTVYGAPLAPYPGFSFGATIGAFFGGPFRYGLGLAMGPFLRMPWGWIGWGLDWRGHDVLFGRQSYFTHSRTVADWGFARRGSAYRNAEYGRAARDFGRPANGFARGWEQAWARSAPAPRPADPWARTAQPFARNQQAYPRNYAAPRSSYARQPQQAWESPRAELSRGESSFARTQAYARQPYAGGGETFGRSGYGGDVYRAPQSFSARSAQPFASPSRAPESNRAFAQKDRFRGFRPSGEGREKSFAGGHAPKSYFGGGRGGASRGGHSGGGRGHRR